MIPKKKVIELAPKTKKKYEEMNKNSWGMAKELEKTAKWFASVK